MRPVLAGGQDLVPPDSSSLLLRRRGLLDGFKQGVAHRKPPPYFAPEAIVLSRTTGKRMFLLRGLQREAEAGSPVRVPACGDVRES